MSRYQPKHMLLAGVMIALLVANAALMKQQRDAEGEIERLRARIAELENQAPSEPPADPPPDEG